MQIVECYQTSDGRLFETLREAEDYEMLITVYNDLMESRDYHINMGHWALLKFIISQGYEIKKNDGS